MKRWLVAAAVLGAGCAEGAADEQAGGYGFGRPATAEDIALLDIDVRPDGRGLPAGQGSVAEGEVVYQQQCLVCHGPTGTEGPNDRLVGRVPDDAFPFANEPGVRLTIGNYWPYATTLFDYINRAMPFDEPGSLPVNDVYAVTALLLHWNDIVPQDAVMNAQTLPAVAMPSRNRFVVDNRTGGPVIR